MKKKPAKVKAVKAWAEVCRGYINVEGISTTRAIVELQAYYDNPVVIPVLITPLPPKPRKRKAKR